jgi:hypothetical protein
VDPQYYLHYLEPLTHPETERAEEEELLEAATDNTDADPHTVKNHSSPGYTVPRRLMGIQRIYSYGGWDPSAQREESKSEQVGASQAMSGSRTLYALAALEPTYYWTKYCMLEPTHLLHAVQPEPTYYWARYCTLEPTYCTHLLTAERQLGKRVRGREEEGVRETGATHSTPTHSHTHTLTHSTSTYSHTHTLTHSTPPTVTHSTPTHSHSHTHTTPPHTLTHSTPTHSHTPPHPHLGKRPSRAHAKVVRAFCAR